MKSNLLLTAARILRDLKNPDITFDSGKWYDYLPSGLFIGDAIGHLIVAGKAIDGPVSLRFTHPHAPNLYVGGKLIEASGTSAIAIFFEIPKVHAVALFCPKHPVSAKEQEEAITSYVAGTRPWQRSTGPSFYNLTKLVPFSPEERRSYLQATGRVI